MKAEKGKNPNNPERSLPAYEPPVMITYSEEELLDDIETMSVQACVSAFSSYHDTGVIC